MADIQANSSDKSLSRKRTRRGRKAGQKHNKITSAPKTTRGRNVAWLPTVLYTNCRSLNEWKLVELELLSQIHQPQLICLTETWLTQEKENSRQLNGFQSFYCNRKNRIGGGVGILAAQDVPTSIVSSHTTDTYSAIWTLSKIPNYDDIITACIYHPPGCEIDETLEYLGDTLSSLCKTYPLAKFIITGDFNRLPVEELLAELDIESRVNFNTRENAMLDLVLTNITEYQLATELSPICNNDHCCILLKARKAKKTPKYVRKKSRLITPERKNRVLCDLARETWNSVLAASNVHAKVEELHRIVNKILDRHCPFRLRKIRRDKPAWMTASLAKLITKRDKAYKNKSMTKWRNLRCIAQRRVRASKQAFIKQKLNSNQNTRDWWATLKNITQPNQSSSVETATVVEGRPMSSETFCDKLNDYYISVGGEYEKPMDIPQSSSSLQPLSIGEIKLLLGKLNTTKSTSTEDFPTWVSLDGKEDLCIPMTDIVNSMLKSAEFPSKWKRSQIKPIPKVSCPSKLKDYRPVSMLFHLGKLSEQVIIDKMRSKLESIIDPCQYAYQPNIGTVDALIQLIDDFTAQLDNPNTKFVQSAALDFSKAFDRLQPAKLIEKMISYEFDSNITALVADFLHSRMQCVRYGSSFSRYKPNKIGAPQGTKLGPILWLIHSNDLQANGYQHIKYADDTTLYTSIRDLGQQSAIVPAIETTQTWSANNNMILNAEKTEIMNTCLSFRSQYDDDLFLDDVKISPSECTKFLGIFIDNKLSFNSHVNSLVSKCNARLFLMRKLKTFGLNNDGLKTFYVSNIRSVMSYAAPAWYTLLSNTNKQRLERIQRSATRIITPDIDYDERLTILQLPYLNDFLFDLAHSHFVRIMDNQRHPLFSRLSFNTGSRTSSRANFRFRPKRCRTNKRSNSFFIYFMTYHDNHFVYKT